MACAASSSIVLRLGAAACAAAVVAGCASPVPVRAERASGAVGVGGGMELGQAAAWEAVFLPASTAASLAVLGVAPRGDGLPEQARLDDRLPVRRAEPLLATAQWPEPERPTVERTRRVILERDARTVLFFLPREERWWWSWEPGWGWRHR